MKYRFTKYLSWRKWVVPELLRERPIHRWLVFPHSFTDDIVRSLAVEWGLGTDDLLLDPFVGAGTTVLAAKQLNIPAIGFDLSPLATLTASAKVANHEPEYVEDQWRRVRRRIRLRHANGEAQAYAELVREALPGKKLATFHGAKAAIEDLDVPAATRKFFMLALLAQIPKYSNAVPTGGWLSWTPNRRPAERLAHDMGQMVYAMLADLREAPQRGGKKWRARLADARRLPVQDGACSAVITSPPYPNRHDYTRVFGVELMFGFLDWEGTRDLRYQLLHSHPEAKPDRPAADGYEEPSFIARAIRQVAMHEERERIVAMLRGYFLDLFLSLKEVARALRPGGRAAFVVGNAQYDGVPVEVDRATAQIGEQAGLRCMEIRIVRERGNSAQQMKEHGRRPSRESVVIFEGQNGR
ncbi:MAG: site-specific DNA-methyltransferase [Phycisphaerae bacterium]|nr:site-specific DNA-methyltransferase [Phycisphaerae bacterium]